MREIFPPKPRKFLRGAVFYTIRPEDVGKTVIETEIGKIHAGNFMGKVKEHDVGKRIIGVCSHETFHWSVESDSQRNHRIEIEQEDT